jgi:hypothetical protein
MRDTLIYGSLVGLLLAWLAHALFPSRTVRGSPQAMPAASPTGGEWLRAAILLVPVGYFLVRPGEASFPLVVAAMTILRQAEYGMGRRLALGLLVGNLIGGIAATVAYAVLSLSPQLFTLCLVLLAVGLLFGGRIAMGGARAPVYVVSLIVFITLLGLGLPALTSGSGEQFAARIWGVLFGACYALGALILLGKAKRAAVADGRAF